ncbi:Mitochondrial outer membrane protein iml2 [Orbilia ellipsospora]|uniref:Mitochondrial outer membrane protein iml2 n=1 Tax=Orbilia ellipsospora TaxID=2528407 RepID=A0AAV9XM85_9PEZI
MAEKRPPGPEISNFMDSTTAMHQKDPSSVYTETHDNGAKQTTGFDSKRASLKDRLGLLSVFIFFGSTVFAAICMAWFAFLWWGTVENSVWRSIVLNNWAVRAISLPSSFLRIAITIQASACLSMLAALAIEKAYIPLPHLAPVSIMRATSPSSTDMLLKFAYPMIRSTPMVIRDLGVMSIVGLTTLMLMTSWILGFTSTILLSDVVIQPIPSNEFQIPVPVDFLWHNPNDQGPGGAIGEGFIYILTEKYYFWKNSPPTTFPAFAEYSTDPLKISGLSDTGPSIRAFLPFPDSENRGSISSYKAKTLVWDARVICQKPKVIDFTPGDVLDYQVSGRLQNTVPLDVIKEPKNGSVPFTVYLPLTSAYYGRPIIYQIPKYDNPYTDFGTVSGMTSQFKLENTTSPWLGNTYLILNQTRGSDIEQFLNENPDWAEIGSIDDIDGDVSPSGFGTTSKIRIAGTLCYTPLDAVDREVTISSYKLQTEPATFNYKFYEPLGGYKFEGDTYVFDNIMPRLVPGSPGDLLRLEVPQEGWAAVGANNTGWDGPWSSDYDEYNGTASGHNFLITALDIGANTSVFLLDAVFSDIAPLADSTDWTRNVGGETVLTSWITSRTWMSDLFKGVQNHPNGNTARALQALLTTVASTAYYEFLQKLDRLDNATVSQFRNVSSPGGPYGTRRGSNPGNFSTAGYSLIGSYPEDHFPTGYVIIAVVLVFQTIIAFIILLRFLQETSVTRIGDPWQTLAQVASGDFEIESILELSRKTQSKRSTIAEDLEAKNKDNVRVGIEPHNGSVRLTAAGTRANAEV